MKISLKIFWGLTFGSVCGLSIANGIIVASPKSNLNTKNITFFRKYVGSNTYTQKIYKIHPKWVTNDKLLSAVMWQPNNSYLVKTKDIKLGIKASKLNNCVLNSHNIYQVALYVGQHAQPNTKWQAYYSSLYNIKMQKNNKLVRNMTFNWTPLLKTKYGYQTTMHYTVTNNSQTTSFITDLHPVTGWHGTIKLVY